MTNSQRRVNDLTIEEFVALIRTTVREILDEQASSTTPSPHPQAGLLDLPPLNMGGMNPDIPLISWEEYYDDDILPDAQTL
jgi:hypothetical protein